MHVVVENISRPRNTEGVPRLSGRWVASCLWLDRRAGARTMPLWAGEGFPPRQENRPYDIFWDVWRGGGRGLISYNVLYLLLCGDWEVRLRKVARQEPAGTAGCIGMYWTLLGTGQRLHRLQTSAGPVEGKGEERREGTARLGQAPLTSSGLAGGRPVHANMARGEKRPVWNVRAGRYVRRAQFSHLSCLRAAVGSELRA